MLSDDNDQLEPRRRTWKAGQSPGSISCGSVLLFSPYKAMIA